VQVEYVARIRFTSRRSSQQQGHCSVCYRVLGQVIVDDQRVSAVVSEVLTHSASRVRRKVLERRRIRCGRADDDRVVHRTLIFQCLCQLCNGRRLLSDRNVDADDVFALLIDDRIDGDSRLTGLSVADNQLTLSSSDRDHGVDRLDTGLQRLVYGLSQQYARRYDIYRSALCRADGAFAVQRHSQRVDDTSDHGVAYRNLYDGSCRLDDIAFLDVSVGAQDYGTDVVFFKVLCHSVGILTELQQLAGHAVLQTIDSGDTVTYLDDRTEIGNVQLAFIILYLFFYDRTDFLRS